ncbi:hypothetical protein DRQ53_15275 [bacterium]|nr:MAG: hypothetical protein DRQ53_15275 [bacterium]
MKRILLPVLFVSLTFWGTSWAQLSTPDPFLSTASSPAGQIFICPAGDGYTIPHEASVITVTLVDASGVPVAGYPGEDIVIERNIPGKIVFCEGGERNYADTDTDAMGMTIFSQAFSGTGCTQGGLRVVVGGIPLEGDPLPLDVISFDMNGDCVVDFRDFVKFSTSYGGAYSYCADFRQDSVVDDLDFIDFYNHYCHPWDPNPPASSFAMAGEIGLFFDTAGTQSGIQGLGTGDTFEFYVVALSAPGGIAGFQYGITFDATNVRITEGTSQFPGISIGGLLANVNMGLFSGCEQISGPTVLVSYQATLWGPVTDSPICLVQSDEVVCNTGPTGPSYISCVDGERLQFNQAYEGCAFINGMGPVASEPTTWGSLKALYRD